METDADKYGWEKRAQEEGERVRGGLEGRGVWIGWVNSNIWKNASYSR